MLCHSFQRIPSLKKPNIRLYRDFWLYVVVSGLSTTSVPQQWQAQLRSVAAKSPNLLSDGADHYLGLDLELSFVADALVAQPKVFSELQAEFLELLGKAPDTEQLVNQLSFVQCAFLKSLFLLEHMRLRVNPLQFSTIFLYLEDRGLQREPAVWSILCLIVLKLLDEYIQHMSTEPLGRPRMAQLEDTARSLIRKCVHLNHAVRRLASSALSRLMESFPYLWISTALLSSLLETLEVCSELIAAGGRVQGRASRMVQSSIVQLETQQQRLDALAEFGEVILKCVQKAKNRFPHEANSLLQVNYTVNHYIQLLIECHFHTLELYLPKFQGNIWFPWQPQYELGL